MKLVENKVVFEVQELTFPAGMGVRVRVVQGELEGKVRRTAKGREYVQFLGVPYATAERFAHPQPPPTWQGVKKANSKILCAQNDLLFGRGATGKEDGLVANIYSCKEAMEAGKDAKLPVMVFIHGGAFALGDGTPNTYGPAWLLDHGIVLVTVNYRLGPLGFLSTGDDTIPANLVRDALCS